MATYYWVGGAGTWDDVTTTNWAASSGGAGGAGVPTSVDDAVFDSASNATAYTVTIDATAVCNDWTVAGPASGNVTFSGTGGMRVYGSLTWPATGMTRSYTGTTSFLATGTSETITTNGIGFGASLVFNGVGATWTLGSAISTNNTYLFTEGTFDTAGYTVTSTATSNGLVVNAATPVHLMFNNSTLNIKTFINLTGTGLSLDAGTSQFNVTSSGGTWNVNLKSGLTFYNFAFTGSSGNIEIRGGDVTFNNLTFNGKGSGSGFRPFSLSANYIVNGVLSIPAGDINDPKRRVLLRSNVVGVQRTITVNGSASVDHADFRDIVATGTAAPISGTRLGDGGNNSGITFAPKTVYWNLAAGGNWTSNGWTTSSGGAVDVLNFPLGGDTIIFDDTGLTAGNTVTFDSAAWYVGSIDASSRTTAMTLATGSLELNTVGDLKLSSSVTFTGTGLYILRGYTTQETALAGNSLTRDVRVFMSPGGVAKFTDAMVTTGTFTLNQDTVEFAAGATSSASTFTLNGSATQQNTIHSTVAGTQATISQASGTVNAQYLAAKDIAATGGAVWNLVNGSVNQDNLSGWYVAHQQNAYYPGGMF
jgi:hypothetical protein